MTAVVWHSYTTGENPRDKWDAGMLELLFSGELWDPSGRHDFTHHTDLDEVPDGDGAVVVFPAGIHANSHDRLNGDLARFPWVLLILTADEGSLFETKHVHHDNVRLWVMTPRPGVVYPTHTRFIGEGFHRDTPKVLAELGERHRIRDSFFSGQVTHERRREARAALRDVGVWESTTGFAQGLDRDDYLTGLASACCAPAPAGPVTPDSFRLYEALEAGAVPLADGHCPDYDTTGYWEMVTPGHPFPVIDEWTEAAGLISNTVAAWPASGNRCFAWWQSYKRSLAYQLVDDLTDLGAPSPEPSGWRDRVTILISTSPVPSNPSTDIIEETVGTIRDRFPDAEILIGVDGVRHEQEHRRPSYQEFTERLLWLCNHTWDNVLPVVHNGHQHQTGMVAHAIGMVRTPLILYVEHDLPLCGEIPFDSMALALEDGTADAIRVTINTTLEPTHRHMMLDTQIVHGVPMTRTAQWSQHPHLATAAYYREISARWFDPNNPTYIEWAMHGPIWNEYRTQGEMAWFRNRLWIFTPDGDMRRCYHLDGRAGDPVFAS